MEAKEPSCNTPSADPKRARRLPGPTMEELQLDIESHRQMEIFWGKILGGSVIGGGIIIGGPSVIPPLLRWVPAVVH
jgi:hypothetical protein